MKMLSAGSFDPVDGYQVLSNMRTFWYAYVNNERVLRAWIGESKFAS